MTEFCNRDEATCRLLKLNPFLDAAMKQDDPPADKTLTMYLYKPTFPAPDKDV